MNLPRSLCSASLALVLAIALGNSTSLAAPSRQGPAPGASDASEPTTLPRCSDMSRVPPASGNDPAAPATGEGVQEAPSAGVGSGEQFIAARGASTGGFGNEATLDPRGGTVPVDCADTSTQP